MALLGQGATGAVYECANVYAPELRAAVKELRAGGDRERLRREATILASLDHPGAVRVRDLVIEDKVWLVMDLVRGIPLARSLPLPPDAALECCRRLADTVAYLHAAGVAHRDLKPSNVILSGGHPIIVDFGLGSALRGTDAGAARPGTLAYTAPELLDDRVDIVRPDRADVYALGRLFAEIWTGRSPDAPSPGPALNDWLRTRRRCPEVDPGEGVPAEIRALVLAMTTRSPEQRPSAAEVVAALHAAAPEFARAHLGSAVRMRRGLSRALLATLIPAIVLLRSDAETPRCDPAPEVVADGLDQDCDGADRLPAMFVRRGDVLAFTRMGSDASAGFSLDARLVASDEGTWVGEPTPGGTRLRRILDNLSLGPEVQVAVRGRPAEDAGPGRILLVDEEAGVVHRVDLRTGEVLQTVGVPGVDHALGRPGAPDLWVTWCEVQGCRIGRRNWIGQRVGDHPLPGPAEGLVAVGSAVVAVGPWGAVVLDGDGPPVLLPPPPDLGAPKAMFADSQRAVAWVGDGTQFARVEPAARTYTLAADAHDLRSAPWFPAETVDLLRTPDADGDGWLFAAWRGADCDDHDAGRNPGASDPVGDGVDQDCSGADGPPEVVSPSEVSRTVWTVRDALDWTPLKRPFRVTLGGVTTEGAAGGEVERAVGAGVSWARIEVEGYIPVIRPLGYGAPYTRQEVLMLPSWTAMMAGPRYGEWYGPGAAGLTTVATDLADPAANFPGVRFDLLGSDRGAYLAGGEPEGADVRVQMQYGWIFWRGMRAGRYLVSVTPPDGSRCWLPGDAEPLRGAVEVVLQPNTLTYLLVGCEEVKR